MEITSNERESIENLFKEINYGLVDYFIDVNDRTKNEEVAKVRTIAPNEIVIEFDSDDKQRVESLVKRTIKRLHQANYSYFVFDHQGRSPHIHIPAIYGLEQLDEDLRKQYKKTFIEIYCSVWDVVYPEVDMSMTNNGCLIAREFKPHFKHSTIKDLVSYKLKYTEQINSIDMRILERARNRIEFYQSLEKNRLNDYTDYSWVINWVTNTPIEQGDRDITIYKNIAILIINKNLDSEPIINSIQSYDYSAGREIKGWMKWAKSSKKFFNIKEIERYCERHDLDILELMKQWTHKD